MRAFALVGVVIFHLFGISGVLTAGGDSLHERLIWTIFGNTLDVFFVLSGFLLFLPLIRRKGEIGRKSDWLIKRFGRLQPEYWACLVVLLLVIALVPVDFQPAMPSFGLVVLHVFDLQTAYRMIDPEVQVGFWIDGALWLVPVIAGLYLVFPFVARFFYRHMWSGLFIAMVLTVAWKLAPQHLPGIFQGLSGHVTSNENLGIIAHDQTPAYFFSFALGMTAARIFAWARQNPENPWIRRAVVIAFVIGIPAYLIASIPYTDAALQTTTGFDGSSRGRGLVVNSLITSSLRTILLLALILGPVWIQRPFANRTVSWVADRSYGIYLIHLPIAFYTAQFIHMPQTGTVGALMKWSILVLPMSIVYANLSRWLIGQPARLGVDRWVARRNAHVKVDDPRPT